MCPLIEDIGLFLICFSTCVPSWIFEKVASENLAICTGMTLKVF